MNGVANVASQNPFQSCWNTVQEHIESVQNQICGSFSTDCKIYTMLILGRVLQTAALVSGIAAVAVAFIVSTNAFVAGGVLTVALGCLGTYLANQAAEGIQASRMSRPFVPGQPVGLNNGGANCWINAPLQMLMNAPALRERLPHIPELNDFVQAYTAARNDSQKVANAIDTQRIRQQLHRGTNGQLSSSAFTSEDAAALFEYLFQGGNSLHVLQQQLGGFPSAVRREPMLSLEIDRGNLQFNSFWRNFFNHVTDQNVRQEFAFQNAPNDQLIHLKRFYRNREGGLEKINDAIEVPMRLQLPRRAIRSDENPYYECDAFLNHNGTSINGGHYVAYVKIGEVWWQCNDSSVLEVTKEQVAEAMKQSYILHYKKV